MKNLLTIRELLGEESFKEFKSLISKSLKPEIKQVHVVRSKCPLRNYIVAGKSEVSKMKKELKYSTLTKEKYKVKERRIKLFDYLIYKLETNPLMELSEEIFNAKRNNPELKKVYIIINMSLLPKEEREKIFYIT